MIKFYTNRLPLTRTSLVDGVVKKYLEGSKEVLPLMSGFADKQGFEKLLAARRTSVTDRSTLVEVLQQQYDQLRQAGAIIDESVASNISSLSSDSTFTVTTGHQLQLAGGPLFFTYKLISAIRLAEELRQQFAPLHVVPIFWLASEDHDMVEINHFNSRGRSYNWPTDYKGPAGKATCNGLDEVWSEVQHSLAGLPFAEELMEMLKDAYKASNNLSLATRLLVNRLFGKFGLVVLDPDDKRLKSEMVEIFKKDLTEQATFHCVNETIKQFSVLDTPQVKPRTINLFYLSSEGRHRIALENDRYTVLDTTLSFSKEEILTELQQHPEQFSPNVLLRPVYQEKILPNIAYIGGPGETAYWLECKRMFDYFEVTFPILVFRNNLLFIDKSTVGRMAKLGMTDEQLFIEPDTWIREFTERNSELKDPFPSLVESTASAYEKLLLTLTTVDPTLGAAVQAEQQKALKGLAQLKDKWIRAEKRKQETALSQYQRVREQVFPNGHFQERHESLLSYFAQYGPDILETWMQQIRPGDGTLTILHEIVN